MTDSNSRKFFKQVIVVTVLSEDVPLEWDDLRDLHYAIDQGDYVGQTDEVSCQELTPKEAAGALYKLGSEASFFQLTDDGESLL